MKPAMLSRNPEFDDPYDDARYLAGPAAVLLDGEPFPWPTVGPWIVKIEQDNVATLTVSIAVTLPEDEGQH